MSHQAPVSQKRVTEGDHISWAERIQIGPGEREHTRERQRRFVPATAIDCSVFNSVGASRIIVHMYMP